MNPLFRGFSFLEMTISGDWCKLRTVRFLFCSKMIDGQDGFEVYGMSEKFVVIDLETTGNSPKKGDKIIQFAAAIVQDGKIVEQYSSFVNPEQEISPFIEELTGITTETVKSAPLFAELAPKILTMLDGAYFVAHNVLFDLSFLQEELVNAGYTEFTGPIIDTVELARILFPTADSYKLNDLALKEHLNHDRPHQADSDAYVTAELLLIFLQQLQNLPSVTIRQLLKLSKGLKCDFFLLLDRVLVEKEGRIEEHAPTIEVYRGLALRKQVNSHEEIFTESATFPYTDDEKEALFQKAFEQYEKRSGQFKMIDTVFQAFADKDHVLIEAGTGVGKSISYLLPAAIFSKQTEEPVIVSTYTIQLQEQLLVKDIPLLQKMVPFQVKTALLKGRSHYLSLAKFEQSLHEADDNYDTCLTKMQILVWLMGTKTGDRDELNLSSGGNLFWNKIKNDETAYFQSKHWLSYDYYLRARKSAQAAHLIITNHALLLTDLIADHAILPPYRYCVIDEGHHFETAAGKYFGQSIDYLTVRLLLNQFGIYEHHQYFYQLEELLKVKVPEEQLDAVRSFEISQLFSELQFEMDDFFRIISHFAKKKSKKSAASRLSYRLKVGDASTEWLAVITSAGRFSNGLRELIAYVDQALKRLKMSEEAFTEAEKTLLADLSTFQNELVEVRYNLETIILKQPDGFVAWVEMDLRALQNATTIYSQPVAISEQLQEHFFAQKDSVIITSATLSVKNSFQFIIDGLGLHSFDVKIEQIESPFRYEEQVQLVIPTDLPEVNAVPLDEYVAAISEHIISIAEGTKGRMLILFTSYEMLRKTYELLKESGLLDEYIIIGQGITGGSRTRLARNFQQFEKSILLGTSSFWEGVDIPGDDLTCLIIVRLPFSPPNEPLTEAKCELIKKNGGNAFSAYSLPEAIIRFKQGFGRLIRTSTDRGFVVVFDKRLHTTSYGKAFLQSIPKVPVKNYTINELTTFIDEWL